MNLIACTQLIASAYEHSAVLQNTAVDPYKSDNALMCLDALHVLDRLGMLSWTGRLRALQYAELTFSMLSWPWCLSVLPQLSCLGHLSWPSRLSWPWRLIALPQLSCSGRLSSLRYAEFVLDVWVDLHVWVDLNVLVRFLSLVVLWTSYFIYSAACVLI